MIDCFWSDLPWLPVFFLRGVSSENEVMSVPRTDAIGWCWRLRILEALGCQESHLDGQEKTSIYNHSPCCSSNYTTIFVGSSPINPSGYSPSAYIPTYLIVRYNRYKQLVQQPISTTHKNHYEPIQGSDNVTPKSCLACFWMAFTIVNAVSKKSCLSHA